jgi:hypothetical protein
LRRWLREIKNLSDTEEEVVYICEPEVGKSLSDEEGRSSEDLIDFQGRSSGISYFQVGNEMGSVDLIDCQDGRKRNPRFPGGQGRGEETSSEVS